LCRQGTEVLPIYLRNLWRLIGLLVHPIIFVEKELGGKVFFRVDAVGVERSVAFEADVEGPNRYIMDTHVFSA